MADNDANSTPSTPVGTADVSNASALVESVSVIRQALADSSTAVLASLAAIATAITEKLVGGVVGTTTNRLLKSKTVSSGSSAGSLQASGITCDNSNNLSGIGDITGATWKATVISPVYGGTGVANNAANLLAWSGNFAATFTLTNTTAVTFPTSGTLATLNTNTWAQQQGFAQVSLTDAATITWNAQTQQSAYVLLTSGVGGTRALGAPSNQVAGFTYILRVQQSATGSNALTYNGVFKWPGGVAPVLSTANNAIDILTFVSDGTNMNGVIQKNFS